MPRPALGVDAVEPEPLGRFSRRPEEGRDALAPPQAADKAERSVVRPAALVAEGRSGLASLVGGRRFAPPPPPKRAAPTSSRRLAPSPMMPDRLTVGARRGVVMEEAEPVRVEAGVGVARPSMGF